MAARRVGRTASPAEPAGRASGLMPERGTSPSNSVSALGDRGTHFLLHFLLPGWIATDTGGPRMSCRRYSHIIVAAFQHLLRAHPGDKRAAAKEGSVGGLLSRRARHLTALDGDPCSPSLSQHSSSFRKPQWDLHSRAVRPWSHLPRAA